jgi:O-antigen ligase
MRRLVLICIGMLMLTIVMESDRPAAEAGLDASALLKVACRAAAMGVLAVVVACTFSDVRRGPVIRQLLPWLTFGAWAVVSTAWSPLQMFSIGQAVSLLILLTLSYCTAVVARRMSDASCILMYICLGLLLLSTVLIVAHVVSPGTFSESRTKVTGGLHPTNVAATAGLGLVLIVAARLGFAWRWTRWLIWPSLVIHSGALLFALNRASLLVTTLVVGGIILLYASAVWRWLLLTSASFACAIYIAVDPGFLLVTQGGGAVATFVARDQSVQQLSELSGREEMWTAIWDSYLRSPWVGHGYFVCSETGSLKVWYEWSNWTAHNFWLQVLVGTGIIGGALIAWALTSYTVRLVCARGQGVGLRRLSSLGIAVLVWQTLWGLTNESFAGPLQAESIVFFAVLGCVTGRMVRESAAAKGWVRNVSLAAHRDELFAAPKFQTSF